MAPEQLTPGAPLSERTDLYALGLILYELVVGQHPFKRSADAASRRGRRAVPDVDPQLERVILQALSPDPRDRPASARRWRRACRVAAGESDRARSNRGGRGGWRPRVAAVVACSPLASLVVARRAAPRPLTEQDTIVLADFANTTGEPVFDGALKVALAVALEQSPFLKVFPDDRMRETLRLMGRPPDDADHARGRARDRAARTAEGAARRIDRRPRHATTCSRSRPSTRRPAT